MKKFLTLLLVLASAGGAYAYETPGSGETYTLQSLSLIEGSGITAVENGYLLSESLTIAANDKLQLISGDHLMMADKTLVEVLGEALFNPEEKAYILRADEEAEPSGFQLTGKSTLKNLEIQGGGIKYLGQEALIIEDCDFLNINDNGGTSYGVIILSGQSTGSKIVNCTFKDCIPSAVNTPANLGVDLLIEGCHIENVSTCDLLRPYINVTSPTTGELIIRNNVLIGAKLEKPGGIGVSNMLNLVGDNKVLVENNTVTDCSWGLNFIGGMNIRVIGNVVKSNRWDPTDNGGIAATLYSITSYPLEVYAEGNTFEDNKWGPCAVGATVCNFGKTDDVNADDYNPGNNVFINNHFTSTANEEIICDIANSTPNTMYAQGNVWNNAETAEEAAATIFSNLVDPAKYGPIVYDPIRPASGIKNIHSSNMPTISGQVEVYTLDGQLVTTTDANLLNDLNSGVYILRAGKVTQKIIR